MRACENARHRPTAAEAAAPLTCRTGATEQSLRPEASWPPRPVTVTGPAFRAKVRKAEAAAAAAGDWHRPRRVAGDRWGGC